MSFKRRISLTCSVISEKTYWTTNFNKNFFKERSTKRAETSTMLWPSSKKARTKTCSENVNNNLHNSSQKNPFLLLILVFCRLSSGREFFERSAWEARVLRWCGHAGRLDHSHIQGTQASFQVLWRKYLCST